MWAGLLVEVNYPRVRGKEGMLDGILQSSRFEK
jgi:hypothetical protein